MFASTCRSAPKNLSTLYMVKMYSLLTGGHDSAAAPAESEQTAQGTLTSTAYREAW
jgi:hypothetical protein